MNDKTLTALEASIAHWEKNAAGEFDGTQAENCALCHLFFDDDCEDCPVAEETGDICCGGSPYGEAADAVRRFGKTSLEFMAAAQKEVDFLKSLLPKVQS